MIAIPLGFVFFFLSFKLIYQRYAVKSKLGLLLFKILSELNKDNCLNSVYHGMSITVDMLDDQPDKFRIFTLRSFGESLYHSITDASLEFGYLAK